MQTESESSEGAEGDGMVEVMRMFTYLTNALFASLEQAADGLEELLLNILNLTGKYTEILVPRPGVFKCPDAYYKAFNKWLLGRMFYISSVDKLSRIHPLSRQVQLRVLHTLQVKGATFYSELQLQYYSILVDLFTYYQDNIDTTDAPKLILHHFTPDHINIPIDKLDLSPVYVEVTDVKQCCTTIELVLMLLRESIPLLSDDSQTERYEELFCKIIHAMTNFDVKVKLAIVQFFVKLIEGYNKVALAKFDETYPDVCNKLLLNIESLLVCVQLNHDIGGIDGDTENIFNAEIANLLELELKSVTYNADIIKSISTLVLTSKSDSKVFGGKLKNVCLKFTSKVDVPEQCLHIYRLSASEINLISSCYEQKILATLKSDDSQSDFEAGFYYRQLINEVSNNCNSIVDVKLDYFVIVCHLDKLNAVLKLLQRIQINYDSQNKSNNCKKILSKDNCSKILNNIEKMYSNHSTKLKTDSRTLNILADLILGVAVLTKAPRIMEINKIMQLSCLQSKSDFPLQALDLKKEVQVLILKQLLLLNIFFGSKCEEKWKKHYVYLMKALSSEKPSTCIIPMAPLLMMNKVITENQLIGEHLLPALLTKNAEIQKDLPKSLKEIGCLSFGDCVLSLESSQNDIKCHIVFENNAVQFRLVCSKCHNIDKSKKTPEDFIAEYAKNRHVIFKTDGHDGTSVGKVTLFEKFLNVKNYANLDKKQFLYLLECFSNHSIFSEATVSAIFTEKSEEDIVNIIQPFLSNIMIDSSIDDTQKEAILNVCINKLVHSTQASLECNNYSQQKFTLDCIREFGLLKNAKVLLPSTKLLVYFIMHPQNPLADKAVVYLKEICEKHNYTTNQIYHRYKKDYCRLFVDCSLYSEQYFGATMLKVLRAFGFVGLVDFISKDVHHFLPYLIAFASQVEQVPAMIDEIASLVQCTSAEFLSEIFPHVYTHIYLYESDQVAKKSFDLIEKVTGSSILNLIIKHHRVILMDLLLQYCSNPEKVLKACRYLARHDPDTSNTGLDQSLTLSQIADFLQPRFLGVLAYFDNKLVSARVALSVKRKALQSFPDIMKLMGSKYLTPLRFKVLATLRSTLSLAKEFPKLLAQAWSAFIHNIDSISLGPLLSNLAVSLVLQLQYAPVEINKIFQYLVLSNENLLSAHISDLFFLEETEVSERVKAVIRKHVKRTQPDDFLEKVKWYLQHLAQDIADVKIYALTCLDGLLKENREEIHKAVFGRNNIDPVVVQLLERLKTGCADTDTRVRLASGICLGQLGALETGLLPRQYVPPDRSPFAFSISDDCFASAALLELTRAFQYEKDTKIMDHYALTIQEILKVYGISPSGSKKELWDSFPEHVHQILQPLLSSRYFLAFPAQPKKTHPLFGSSHAASFIEWAYNWAGQLVPLAEPASVRELLRSVYPSMRRDKRTLLLFLPYVLLHAAMTVDHHLFIYEEMMHVIGTDSHSQTRGVTDRSRYRLLAPIGVSYEVASSQVEDCNQLQTKCCKTVYKLIDFLNRWLLEWCHGKHHPTQSDKYKSVKQLVDRFDLLSLSRGNLAVGRRERALQLLEVHVQSSADLQPQLSLLAAALAALDEPDAVAGILTLKRSEPSLKELVLAQEVTGRAQDAAFCYERLAQEGHLDKHSLQGMVECYLSLDQPFTAYRLLSERRDESLVELEAESLWRLGRWEQLDRLLDEPIAPSLENFGVVFGRVAVSLRSDDQARFDEGWTRGVARLAGGGAGDALGLHILAEARHAEEMLRKMRSLPDGEAECNQLALSLVSCWRQRARLVEADVRTMEPLLRCRRTQLLQTQHLLERTHPRAADALRSHVGELWLQSAKHARKAGVFQQAYTYVLHAEQYRPARLFIEKARVYWARGQREPAFTTLRRGLEDAHATDQHRRISAKARLLIALYNEETTNVDVDVNLQHYKDAVDTFKQWERSLVCLGAYYEKLSATDEASGRTTSRRLHALNSYGRALQYGHKYIYQTMPRMLSIWLEYDVSSGGGSLQELSQMTQAVRAYCDRLPLYLPMTAFSQIVSRICHPVAEVYQQIKELLVRLLLAYPQHTLWMLMCVMKSSYPQRLRRCQDVLADARLKEPRVLRFVYDFTQLAEKLIELCNKPLPSNAQTASVRSLVPTLPRLLSADSFSQIMMPCQQFCRIVLPSKAARQEERASYNAVPEPLVYIAGVQDLVTVLPSLQHPRKITLTGSDGKPYIIMLKPKDDLRKDFRLMEFNSVVNRFLQEGAETRRRRLYIRTYCVLPLNEECGLIEWVPNLLGLRPILLHLYKQKGILTNNRELKEMMCGSKDPPSRKLAVFRDQLLPRHPPVFAEWYRRVFADPYGWYQARSAYIRTTAVMSMVGYILGLGDRHGENILFDSTNGDSVHVDFNCLFNKGEGFEWPERVPFRLTHNMTHAMGPLGHEGMYRRCCEATMRELRLQTAALMSVVGPFVYDPLVTWSRARAAPADAAERVNLQARQHLEHIRQRLGGLVRTKNKQLSVALSPEGQVEHLIAEATSVDNLSQMYLGWGPFL